VALVFLPIVGGIFVCILVGMLYLVRKEEGDCGTIAKKGCFFPLKRQEYFSVQL